MELSFYNDLDATLSEAWRLLERAVVDRKSPFHTPAIATVRPDGSPAVRTVVLQAADREHRKLRVHTDIRSSKFKEIEAQPQVALHFYDPGRKVQLRIDGWTTLHTVGAVADEAWRATRPFSRACYLVEGRPGCVIEDPIDVSAGPGTDDPEAGRENFAAMSISVHGLEWLYLAARGHRRARFEWHSDHLRANWLVP